MTWRDARVLITGATGFVGANLVRRLVTAGARVTGTGRNPIGHWRLNGLGSAFDLRQLELAAVEAVDALLAATRPSYVFHLATARLQDTAPERSQTLTANVDGTVALIESCARIGVQALVYAGSSLECRRGETPLDEQTPLAPTSFFAATKTAAFVLARERALTLELPLRILRLFSVYGPWEAPHRLIPTLARAAVTGESVALTPPGIRRDFVYADDVVDALLAAATTPLPPGEVVHIGSGRETSNEEIASLVQEVTNHRFELRPGHYAPHATDTGHWCANINKAHAVLGWRPAHDLRAGLRASCDFWRQWLARRPETPA